jgi:hypothetical protein
MMKKGARQAGKREHRLWLLKEMASRQIRIAVYN